MTNTPAEAPVPDRRMDAYYYSFAPTKSAAVDKILGAIACAGKAFHHTNDWADACNPYDDHTGHTPVEWIQNAAIEASAQFTALTAEAERLKNDPAFVEYKRLKAEVESLKTQVATAMSSADAAFTAASERSRSDNERLRAALADVLSYVPHGDMPVTIYDNARAALKEPRT